MRVMALDVGDRRTGVAISDPTGLLARTLRVITQRGDEPDVAAVANLVMEHGVGKLVVGYPRHASGDIGEQARRVEVYAAALAEELCRRGLAVEIVFWDERYSTVEAERILRERGQRPRLRARRNHLDAVAAAVILQDYLDAQRSLPSTLGSM